MRTAVEIIELITRAPVDSVQSRIDLALSAFALFNEQQGDSVELAAFLDSLNGAERTALYERVRDADRAVERYPSFTHRTFTFQCHKRQTTGRPTRDFLACHRASRRVILLPRIEVAGGERAHSAAAYIAELTPAISRVTELLTNSLVPAVLARPVVVRDSAAGAGAGAGAGASSLWSSDEGITEEHIKEVAGSLNLGPGQLSRMLRIYFGTGPSCSLPEGFEARMWQLATQFPFRIEKKVGRYYIQVNNVVTQPFELKKIINLDQIPESNRAQFCLMSHMAYGVQASYDWIIQQVVLPPNCMAALNEFISLHVTPTHIEDALEVCYYHPGAILRRTAVALVATCRASGKEFSALHSAALEALREKLPQQSTVLTPLPATVVMLDGEGEGEEEEKVVEKETPPVVEKKRLNADQKSKLSVWRKISLA